MGLRSCRLYGQRRPFLFLVLVLVLYRDFDLDLDSGRARADVFLLARPMVKRVRRGIVDSPL